MRGNFSNNEEPLNKFSGNAKTEGINENNNTTDNNKEIFFVRILVDSGFSLYS